MRDINNRTGRGKIDAKEVSTRKTRTLILFFPFFLLLLFLFLFSFLSPKQLDVDDYSNLIRHDEAHTTYTYMPPQEEPTLRFLFLLDSFCTLELIIQIIEHSIGQDHKMSSNFGRPRIEEEEKKVNRKEFFSLKFLLH